MCVLAPDATYTIALATSSGAQMRAGGRLLGLRVDHRLTETGEGDRSIGERESRADDVGRDAVLRLLSTQEAAGPLRSAELATDKSPCAWSGTPPCT